MRALVLALLVTGPAHAGDTLTLSYDGALKQALDRNPELLGAEEDLRSADGALLAAKGTFDPGLSASGGFFSSTNETFTQWGDTLLQSEGLSWSASLSQFAPTGTTASLTWESARDQFRYELRGYDQAVETEDPQYSTSLTASIAQSLLKGFKTAYNLKGVRQARQTRDVTKLALLEDRQEVLASVANTYWELWYMQRLVEISEQAVEVAQEEKRIVEAQVAQGRLAPVEVARVDAAVVQAQSTLIDARIASDAAQDMLLLLIGEHPGRDVGLVTQPADVVTVSIDPLEAVSAALANNPSVQSARVAEELAAQNLSAARHARLPELDATASYGIKGYETTNSDSVSELFTGELPDWYLGAELSLPLGNRAARGDYLSRQASLAGARIDREALERSIDQQVRSQVRTLESAKIKLDLAGANLRLAEQTLAADRALQEAGRAIQRDVLESLNNVNDARVELEKAKADYQLAIVELKRLQGDL